MKMSIGFIVSTPFSPYMGSIGAELASYCDILSLVANDNEKAYMLYQQNVDKVDCFIASGLFLYYAVKTKVPDLEKPFYVIDDQRGDLKDVFFHLLLKDRNFDFSRVFVDFACEQNNFLGTKEWLPKEEWPYFGEIDDREIESYEQVEDICRALGRRHYELHEAGLVDLSLTRIGLLTRDFDRDHIPYQYVYPGRDYIVNFFLQIINAFYSGKTKDNVLGSIAIDFGKDAETADAGLAAKTNEFLASYVRQHGYDFTIQKEDDRIVILTRRKDIADITEDFTDCGFKEYIEGVIGKKVSMGIGTGNNFFQAKLNSIKAAEISKARSGKVFFISEIDKLMGPLGSKKMDEFSSKPSPELLEWSRRLHVDHVSLQKIVAYARVSQSTRISADELARHLGITLRSANRLLSKIEANGGASCYLENLKGGRGRPRKCYDLALGDIL
ncbi:MAG: hypothetical protein ABSF43_16885 [Rectinemataceae bacterium]|jgi:hypothetical protein